MNAQMIRVISSPSSSTIGFSTLIFAIGRVSFASGNGAGDAIGRRIVRAMDAERVRIEVADHVADVRMVRADKHNGLDGAMFVALNEALDEFAADRTCAPSCSPATGRASAPASISRLRRRARGLVRRRLRAVDGDDSRTHAQRVAYGWRELEVPVIAALHGACLGGGLQIALAADVRIAAPDTRLSVMEIRYGLVPDMSLAQTLPPGRRRRRPRARPTAAGWSRPPRRSSSAW